MRIDLCRVPSSRLSRKVGMSDKYLENNRDTIKKEQMHPPSKKEKDKCNEKGESEDKSNSYKIAKTDRVLGGELFCIPIYYYVYMYTDIF